MEIEIRKHVDEDLSKLLREFTSGSDIIKVYNETNISDFTLQSLLGRRRKVTEDNKPGLVRLIEIAIENAKSGINKAEDCEKKLTQVLESI